MVYARKTNVVCQGENTKFQVFQVSSNSTVVQLFFSKAVVRSQKLPPYTECLYHYLHMR